MSERLFTFPTTYEASAYLHATRTANELIYVKASIVDHLERLMLAELDEVVSWKERCGLQHDCQRCGDFRIPAPPPVATVVG